MNRFKLSALGLTVTAFSAIAPMAAHAQSMGGMMSPGQMGQSMLNNAKQSGQNTVNNAQQSAVSGVSNRVNSQTSGVTSRVQNAQGAYQNGQSQYAAKKQAAKNLTTMPSFGTH